MKVLVTGASGFIGHHVVAHLLKDGHSVVAIGRDRQKIRNMPWVDKVTFIESDLQHDFKKIFSLCPSVDAMIHLAWPGLLNCEDYFHVEENLPADLRFLKAAVLAGIPHITVAGTCLEYGMQYGPLHEGMQTFPVTAYGLAKDVLRKSLELLQKSNPFLLQWVRLFYMYGGGQNPRCLLAQLDRAIDEGQPVFKMSPGEQLRDYLPVTTIAAYFVRLIENPSCNGVINCCSGEPISIRELVEQRCQERGASIKLERGFYPYPDYEPLAFWGVPEKLMSLKED